MIEDEKSLISIPEFKRMFAMYFKAETKAELIYNKLLPHITCYHINNEVYDEIPHELSGERSTKKMVSIQKLSRFIDAFNFYPVRVNKIKSKNASNELTYIMSSNYSSNLATKVDK